MYYTISFHHEEIIITNNNISRMAIIHKNDVLNYELCSELSGLNKMKFLIKAINFGTVDITDDKDNVSLTCLSKSKVKIYMLVICIPKKLFMYKTIKHFDVDKLGRIIIFRDVCQHIKFAVDIHDLYNNINNKHECTFITFKKIIMMSIEGNPSVQMTIINTGNYYDICYKMLSLDLKFNISIHHNQFKYEMNHRIIDIKTPDIDSIFVLQRINNILSSHLQSDEKYNSPSTLDIEWEKFNKLVDNITLNNPIDNIFNKLGSLYPHLTIVDCKLLAQKYIKNRKLIVHSGQYEEINIEQGCGYYYYSEPSGKYSSWKYSSVKYKRWSCCPTVIITGVASALGYGVNIKIKEDGNYDRGNILINSIMKHNKNICPPFITCVVYNYLELIDKIRINSFNIYALYNRHATKVIAPKLLKLFIEGYGLPRPDTFCLNNTILTL